MPHKRIHELIFPFSLLCDNIITIVTLEFSKIINISILYFVTMETKLSSLYPNYKMYKMADLLYLSKSYPFQHFYKNIPTYVHKKKFEIHPSKIRVPKLVSKFYMMMNLMAFDSHLEKTWRF